MANVLTIYLSPISKVKVLEKIDGQIFVEIINKLPNFDWNYSIEFLYEEFMVLMKSLQNHHQIKEKITLEETIQHRVSLSITPYSLDYKNIYLDDFSEEYSPYLIINTSPSMYSGNEFIYECFLSKLELENLFYYSDVIEDSIKLKLFCIDFEKL